MIIYFNESCEEKMRLLIENKCEQISNILRHVPTKITLTFHHHFYYLIANTKRDIKCHNKNKNKKSCIPSTKN